jgi:hypothetical protein
MNDSKPVTTLLERWLEYEKRVLAYCREHRCEFAVGLWMVKP